jgi:hypothetical protein
MNPPQQQQQQQWASKVCTGVTPRSTPEDTHRRDDSVPAAAKGDFEQ